MESMNVSMNWRSGPENNVPGNLIMHDVPLTEPIRIQLNTSEYN